MMSMLLPNASETGVSRHETKLGGSGKPSGHVHM